MIKLLKTYVPIVVSFWAGGLSILYTSVYSNWGSVPLEAIYDLAKWPWYCLRFWLT